MKLTLKHAVAAVILVLSFAVPVTAQLAKAAQPLTATQQLHLEAAAAYNRRDYVTAVRLNKTLADQGDPDAAWHLGVMYDEGQGVPQDYAEAVKWYREAVARGAYIAESYLGRMYYDGRGVPQDDAEALKWFRPAAEQGDVDAQNYLGLMYYDGRGVRQDYVQAHMWLNLAASRVLAGLDNKVRDEFIQKRNMVAAKMTPAQIAEAQKLAREWKPTTQPSR
jgi:TPR repeat protein